MGTVKVNAYIDVEEFTDAAPLSDVVSALLASNGSSEVARVLARDEKLVADTIAELTPEQLVEAIMADADQIGLAEHFWLGRVLLLLDERCKPKAPKVDDGPPMVGAMGEVVVGGLRWRFIGDHARDKAHAALNGWRIPSLAEFGTASEAIDRAIPDNDPARISLAWVSGMEVSGDDTILWHIEISKPVIGSARDTAALFAVKKVEP